MTIASAFWGSKSSVKLPGSIQSVDESFSSLRQAWVNLVIFITLSPVSV